MKTVLENPEALSKNITSGIDQSINDPDSMVKKFESLGESIKQKAIDVIHKKCEAILIPNELVDIFINICFNQRDKLKNDLCSFIEASSEKALGMKVRKELLASILEIFYHPKNISNEIELKEIVSDKIVLNLILHFIQKITGKDLEEVIIYKR